MYIGIIVCGGITADIVIYASVVRASEVSRRSAHALCLRHNRNCNALCSCFAGKGIYIDTAPGTTVIIDNRPVGARR